MLVICSIPAKEGVCDEPKARLRRRPHLCWTYKVLSAYILGYRICIRYMAVLGKKRGITLLKKTTKQLLVMEKLGTFIAW